MKSSTQELKNFEFGNATDVGKVRSNNEDYLGYFQTPNGHLFVLCDGMGGHQAGEKASQLAVETFKDFFSKDYYPSPQEALWNAIVEANQVIYSTAQKFSDYAGMGTTLVAVLIRDNQVFYAHVGDSRLYYFEQATQTLHRITKDHSFVQELVDRGVIKDEDAEKHPRKNEILRALGIHQEVVPEVGTLPILPADNDLLLLCSDGLNGMISDFQIAEIITDKTLNILQRTQKLIEKANEAGGTDNITVQLVRFYAQQRSQATLPAGIYKSVVLTQLPSGKKISSKHYILGGVIAVVALLVGVWAFQHSGTAEKKSTDTLQAKPTPDYSQRKYPVENKQENEEYTQPKDSTEKKKDTKLKPKPTEKDEKKQEKTDKKTTENPKKDTKTTDAKSNTQKNNPKNTQQNKSKTEQK
jgi:protein phosphatase